MTIKRGEEWGRRVVTPADVIVVSSDFEFSQQECSQPISVLAGDLWRAVGRPTEAIPGEARNEVKIDALSLTVVRPNGSIENFVAVSSIVIGQWFGRGGYTAILSTGFLGDLNLTPRSHPNDGRFEIFQMSPGTPLMQRLIMRRKAKMGSHLPHPGLAVSSSTTFECALTDHGASLRADGRDLGSWKSVSVVCVPDHWRLML